MSRRTLAALLATLAILTLASLLAAGCGGGDDGDDPTPKPPRTTTDDTGDDDDHAKDEDGHADDAGDPTEVPDAYPDGSQPPIHVETPTPLSYVSGSFVLSGTAQVFEGALQWAILDARLKPMVQGRMTASCGAPCRGKFRVRIPLAKVAIGSWELHVWAPPVADDDPDRVHDTMVPITVTDEPVQGAPDAGDIPPGGVPGG